MDTPAQQNRILIVDDPDPARVVELIRLLGDCEHLKGMEIIQASTLVANGGTRTLHLGADDVIHLQAQVGENHSDKVLIIGPGGVPPEMTQSITQLIRNRSLLDPYIPTLQIGPAHDGLPNRDRWGKQRPPRRNHKKSKRR